ncbi:tRNA methyltransferase tyw3 [Podila humilis]|nr:tRNA methyltransferase tyw3 [Podila humilis]
MSSASSSSIPVLIAPPSITKQLKVALDNAGWRDKNRLIARYSQIATRGAADRSKEEATGSDLSSYMALALLPECPFGSLATSSTAMSVYPTSLTSLSDICQQQSTDLAAWPTILGDHEIQMSIYLTRLDSTLFTAPRHLLVQTPYEKLRDSLTKFLTPYLNSWCFPSSLSPSSTTATTTQILSGNSVLSDLLATLPQKWEHYSDFTLLPPTAFLAEPWPQVLEHLVQLDHQQQQQQQHPSLSIMKQLETLVQEALGSTHIARKAIIPVQDILRRPKIRPLTGDWGHAHNKFKSWIEYHQIGLVHHDSVQEEGRQTMRDEKTIAITTTTTTTTTTAAATTAMVTDNFSSAYWAVTCQNQVWYSWCPLYTMFSAGNITEKERVAHSRPIFDARDKIVVDLYAGIGYFTLVYLIHAGAKTVHACEWNPWSVEGLARGADRNGIRWSKVEKPSSDDDGDNDNENDEPVYDDVQVLQSIKDNVTISKTTAKEEIESSNQKNIKKLSSRPSRPPLGNLVIYPGDNAQWISRFENQAHHINLGLIPTAEPGWVLGVRALCPLEGGYLHVHHNIRVGEEETFKAYLLKTLEDHFVRWKADQKWDLHIRHMENIKSFAPMVYHYVADVECRPLV